MNHNLMAIASRYRFKALQVLLMLSILIDLVHAVLTDTGQDNLYAQQAQAFLNGRLHIADYSTDVAVFREHYYVPFPPFPTVLLLPLVALLGVASAKATLFSIALSGLNVVVFRSILKALHVDTRAISWTVGAFFLGTAYWLSVSCSSEVWFFAHVVAVTCTLLAIHEVLTRRRGFYAGLFLGCAFLSRQVCIYNAIFLVVALWRSENHSASIRVRRVVGFIVSLGVCILLYLVLNYLRFGSMLDTGYSHMQLSGVLKERVDRFGLFHPVYIPFNFIYMFVQGFHLEFAPPTYLRNMSMNPYGTSLIFASPFVLAAFRARWHRSLLWAGWATVLLSLLHSLCYYNNGWIQFNAQRFSLDFLPVLMVLVARGIVHTPSNCWKAAVVYSIGLNVFWVSLIPLFNAVMRLL